MLMRFACKCITSTLLILDAETSSIHKGKETPINIIKMSDTQPERVLTLIIEDQSLEVCESILRKIGLFNLMLNSPMKEQQSGIIELPNDSLELVEMMIEIAQDKTPKPSYAQLLELIMMADRFD